VHQFLIVTVDQIITDAMDKYQGDQHEICQIITV
jgi:hypothetical protein